ncbi:MAG: CoA-transferase subunit beta [Planctomycetota bacterium]|jgi:glutaconate CoA-transferase subunit B
MADKQNFTDVEFMICLCARLLEDNKSAFIGYGMPQIAAILAQHLYAPNLCQVYEYGAIGPECATPFKRNMMADARNSYRAVCWTTMNPLMWCAQAGYIDYGVLGAAQMDPFGNINSTFIGGTYERPKIRFVGSGGGNEVGSFCWKTVYLMQHQKRRFVEKCDFVTTPGYIDGAGGREKAGLPAGSGPYQVITTKAVFDFHPDTKRLRLIATREGLSVDEVLDDTGYEVHIADNIETIEPPREKELSYLRETVDPDRVVIGKV